MDSTQSLSQVACPCVLSAAWEPRGARQLGRGLATPPTWGQASAEGPVSELGRQQGPAVRGGPAGDGCLVSWQEECVR